MTCTRLLVNQKASCSRLTTCRGIQLRDTPSLVPWIVQILRRYGQPFESSKFPWHILRNIFLPKRQQNPWALSICMENPEIPGRIQKERFISVEISRKKVKHFEVLPFSRFYRNDRTVFCTICLHYQCQASCREEAKNLPVFCQWYNSIPFLFSVPKKIPVAFDGNFSPKFQYKW